MYVHWVCVCEVVPTSSFANGTFGRVVERRYQNVWCMCILVHIPHNFIYFQYTHNIMMFISWEYSPHTTFIVLFHILYYFGEAWRRILLFPVLPHVSPIHTVSSQTTEKKCNVFFSYFLFWRRLLWHLLGCPLLDDINRQVEKEKERRLILPALAEPPWGGAANKIN
jgi:hypothetical protein